MQVFNYSELRTDLKKIVDSVTQGMVAVIHTKGRKVAIIPFRMLRELEELREAQRSRAGTMAADVPSEGLPPEVEAQAAHSQPRADALAEAFEQPPIEPLDVDEMSDENLDAQLADLLDGVEED